MAISNEDLRDDVECKRRVDRTRATGTKLFAGMMAGFMLIAIAACGGGGGGGGGSGDATGGSGSQDPYDDTDDDDDDTDAVQPTLASIQANVFTPICTECHTGSAAPQGLRLDAGVSYGMLVNVASTEVPSLLRVDPGNPDDSYLVQKLEGTASVGERMPLGGPYLSQMTINAIRQWITDGASETMANNTTPASKTSVSAGWPLDGSTLREAPPLITLIADNELDASLLHSGSVQLFHLDSVNPDALQMQPMENVDLQLSSLAPTVINLRLAAGEWQPGRYEVRVKGSGATPVADRNGRLIDGDGDGEPGGDFILQFTVVPE